VLFAHGARLCAPPPTAAIGVIGRGLDLQLVQAWIQAAVIVASVGATM
jgi:hypothetical protein